MHYLCDRSAKIYIIQVVTIELRSDESWNNLIQIFKYFLSIAILGCIAFCRKGVTPLLSLFPSYFLAERPLLSSGHNARAKVTSVSRLADISQGFSPFPSRCHFHSPAARLSWSVGYVLRHFTSCNKGMKKLTKMSTISRFFIKKTFQIFFTVHCYTAYRLLDPRLVTL